MAQEISNLSRPLLMGSDKKQIPAQQKLFKKGNCCLKFAKDQISYACELHLGDAFLVCSLPESTKLFSFVCCYCFANIRLLLSWQ